MILLLLGDKGNQGIQGPVGPQGIKGDQVSLHDYERLLFQNFSFRDHKE